MFTIKKLLKISLFMMIDFFLDAQVLIYNSDGAVSSSPIIDASKLGLYGSTVTAVADFAQSQSVTTYMASILSQVQSGVNILRKEHPFTMGIFGVL